MQTVAMVTDYDCWHNKHGEVDVEQIIETLNKNSKNAKSLVKNIINVLPKYINKEKDPTENILDKSIITQKKNWNKKTKKKIRCNFKKISGEKLKVKGKNYRSIWLDKKKIYSSCN